MLSKSIRANLSKPVLYISTTLVMAALIAASPGDAAFWGINSSYFLPTEVRILIGLVCVLCVTLFAFRDANTRLGALIDIKVAKILSAGSLTRSLLAIAGAVSFYLLSFDTHLLGDGYAWISIFGQGETYLHKWTEPGSTLIVRGLQLLLGGYTKETSLQAFRIVSAGSGAICLVAIIGVINRLFGNTLSRSLAFLTLLFSGAALLSFGYVEFYPVLWAAALSFFYVAVRYFDERKNLLWVIFLFIFTCFMHLQALYLLPAVMYLVYDQYRSTRIMKFLSRHRFVGAGIALTLPLALFVWTYKSFIQFESMFLPVLTGRPSSPEYAILSLKHLNDLLQEALVVFPGFPVVASLLLVGKKPGRPDSRQIFFALGSLGSLTFLLIVDPVIGMARDWDLFSLTLLPPMLWLLHTVSRRRLDSHIRKLLAPYALLLLAATGSYLIVNAQKTFAEERFQSVLRYYGAKERSGWVIFADYLTERGDLERSRLVLREMNELFPEDRKLSMFYRDISQGKFQSAFTRAKELVETDPYRADFLQALGNAYGKLESFDSARYYYEQAVALKPYHAMLRNEYGQLLLKEGELERGLVELKRARALDPRRLAILEGIGLAYHQMSFTDSTLVIADSLFMLQAESPGGHLLEMVVALSKGDEKSAAIHFRKYKEVGKDRSDYRNILSYYGYLRDR